MLSIYTHTNNILKKEFWKYTIKKIIGKYSGPDAVRDSLLRGLDELNIEYEINPKNPKYNNICVLSGVEALKERIKYKRNNQKIIAGPNLINTPLDHKSILLNNNINAIVVPSIWVKNFYLSIAKELYNKIFVWPAGVEIQKVKTDSSGKIILYKKEISIEVFENVKAILNKLKVNYEILEYGKFSHSEYLNKLESAPYIIYLQVSESQGLALQEAWSYNVPTLVYKNNTIVFKDYKIMNEKLPAPYLNEKTGLFFTLENLEEILLNFNKNNFKPREFCINNLSDKICALKYMEIVNTL